MANTTLVFDHASVMVKERKKNARIVKSEGPISLQPTTGTWTSGTFLFVAKVEFVRCAYAWTLRSDNGNL
jgi:hypothetical protein